MTVKDLIKELQKQDPEKLVVISVYDGGYCDIEGVGEIELSLDVNKTIGMGPHEFCRGGVKAIELIS